ncbi:MAG: hypothetical protein ACRDCE_01000 [Cetobacterium sp.]|uniref:hypothetical protein n=1 Tax=Cetobacterium sp. TaxID=2071632 RepID=UPI003EE477CC
MTTPVEMLGLKYPLCKELIDKMSNKWQKRTQDMITKWPKEGTFDVTLCEEMETLIKNYKIKSSLKKKKRPQKKKSVRCGATVKKCLKMCMAAVVLKNKSI